jgi:hypothetical protein
MFRKNFSNFANSTSLILLQKKTFAKWVPKLPNHRIIFDRNHHNQPHAVWDLKSAENVEITHVKPVYFRDRVALFLVKFFRVAFDIFSRYKPGKMDEARYLRRCIFLETIAGVPGMVGGMARHMRALRGLRNDGGWIHHLLEEAENERMHLLYFLKLRNPGIIMRINIIFGQFIFILYYSLLYSLSSSTAHRFVGYLEEEAVKTYTNFIKDLDEGKLPYLEDKPADEATIRYWGLPKEAKVRDVLLAIRADEVSHREFNHHFAETPKDQPIEKNNVVYVADQQDIEKLFNDQNEKK